MQVSDGIVFFSHVEQRLLGLCQMSSLEGGCAKKALAAMDQHLAVPLAYGTVDIAHARLLSGMREALCKAVYP